MFLVAAAFLFLVLSQPVLAVDLGFGQGSLSGKIGEKSGYDTNITRFTFSQNIGLFIRGLLGLVGMIFLVLTVYAGILWMTAQGAEDQVTKARDIIKTSAVGLIITLAAYGLSTFVVRVLTSSTVSDTPVGSSGSGGQEASDTFCPGDCITPTQAAGTDYTLLPDGNKACQTGYVCAKKFNLPAGQGMCESVSGQKCVDKDKAATMGAIVPGKCNNSKQVCVEK